MNPIEIVISALVLVGSGFTLIGSLGLARLPDFYTRLHGPTKATTLGAGALITASILFFALEQGEPQLHELLVLLFLFLTAPVSAHLLARAALVRGLESTTADAEIENVHAHPDDREATKPPAMG